jgi:hypothetical protein
MSVDDLFCGLHFIEGASHLPGSLVPSLTSIRDWAEGAGLVGEREAQELTTDFVEDLACYWSREDELQIAISIDPRDGDLGYMEYPYVPVKTLIRRELPVELVYWSVPHQEFEWDDSDELPPQQSDSRFAFWTSACDGEFCASTTAKLIVPKFVDLLESVADEFEVHVNADGGREVTAEGLFEARFRKVGRLFDVDFRPAASA